MKITVREGYTSKNVAYMEPGAVFVVDHVERRPKKVVQEEILKNSLDKSTKTE